MICDSNSGTWVEIVASTADWPSPLGELTRLTFTSPAGTLLRAATLSAAVVIAVAELVVL
jgi:hypothetical protein